jgi:hypothetical protein
MTWTPVLYIHKGVLDDKETTKEKQQMLLEAALGLLPDETRDKFLSQKGNTGKHHSIKDLIIAHGFDSVLGAAPDGTSLGNHWANFPEAAGFEHDCRPNTAFYLDDSQAHHTTVVRKIEKGEPLSISYIDPFKPWQERQEWHKSWRGSRCPCEQCTGGGDLDKIQESDARLAEIRSIESDMADSDTRDMSVDTIDHLLGLYKKERLEVRLSDAYGLAALNYNNLGYLKRAQKYGRLAVQAGIIERGEGSNDVIAMQIFLKDPVGHYSWQRRVKGDQTIVRE